jgi:iron complex outermembrane receptor protein
MPAHGQETDAPSAQETQENQEEESTQKALRIEETQVTGEREQEHAYRVKEATTATKTDTPLRDTPQSVQVIDRQVIEDRQILRLSEVADNVSGVQYSSGYGGLSSADYYIRGFSTSGSLRNGFRDFGFISSRDVANIERIEFLKGPASVLYGLLEPGGTVNTITKQPLPYSYYSGDMTFGSFSLYRPTVDLSGPLNASKSLLYRFNLAYEYADSFRDFTDNESIFVAPVLTWRIGPRTTLTTELEYQNYQYTFDRTFRPEPEFLRLPVSRFLGEKLNDATLNSGSARYNFVHQFSDQWTFRQGFLALISNIDQIAANPGSLQADRRTLNRNVRQTNEDSENFGLQNELYGKFSTGPVQHNALLGLEFARYNFSYHFFGATIAPIDIFNPVYGAVPGPLSPSFAEEYGTDSLGLYWQDQIDLRPDLHILGGGRFDWASSEYRDLLTGEKYTDVSDFAFSPRVGIVYQPIYPTSLYFSWSNSFNPQIFGLSRTGAVFEPEEGEQFEFGVKQELLEERLWATLAFYRITKTNVLTTDPEDPDFSIQTGEQRSEGIEFDITGRLLPGWNVIASYAYTDARITEDNDLRVGSRLAAIPEQSFSFWHTYEIQTGALQGLGAGMGLYYASEREATLPNTMDIPSYWRTDASLFYRWQRWKVQLNIKNLFDKKYYHSQGFFIIPQAPLNVLGTMEVEF